MQADVLTNLRRDSREQASNRITDKFQKAGRIIRTCLEFLFKEGIII